MHNYKQIIAIVVIIFLLVFAGNQVEKWNCDSKDEPSFSCEYIGKSH